MSIVCQRDEFVLHDLRVGRVQIGHIQLAVGERAIREIVVEPANVFVRQPVALAQTGPAIRTLEELVTESQAQLRMRGELRHPLDSELARAVATHAQDVRIVETQRLRSPRARARQSGTQLRIVSDGLLRKDLRPQSTAVLRIAIDVAALERAPQHARPTELTAMLRCLTGIARQLDADLAENHGLGEHLRADYQLGCRGAGRDHRYEDDGGSKHCLASRARRVARARTR
jgi:hypothetical protein